MKLNFEKYFEKIMNTKGLVIILLIGVSLLVLPGLFPKSTSTENTAKAASCFSDRKAYEQELEKRLAHMLSTVRGISHVSVMITLEDVGEMYYAQNEAYDEKNTDDGTLTEKERQSEGAPALKSDAHGGQSPILLKTGMPKISGVLITAKGADDATVQAAVISAVRAVLNVAPHRVQVLCKA